METGFEWLEHADQSELPPLTSEGRHTIARSNLDPEAINWVSERVSHLLDAIRPFLRVAFVNFPKTGPHERLRSLEFIAAHWQEISGRCLLALLSANATIYQLVRGFIAGINSSNILILTLTARAALENAASFWNLARFVSGRKEGIEAEVLPYLSGQSQDENSSVLYAPDLVETLTRFQHGVRFLPTGNLPRTPREMKFWMEECQYKSKNQCVDRARPVVSELLEDLGANQLNVITQLEKLAGKQDTMDVLYLYAVLSEFCHPNADNRALAVTDKESTEEVARLEVDGTGGAWSPVRRKGLDYSLVGIAAASHVHIEAMKQLTDGPLLTLRP